MSCLSPTSYLLLTTKPLKRRITLTQHEFINILPLADINGASFTATLHFSDGTTDSSTTINLLDLRKSEVKSIDLGWPARLYDEVIPAKTIVKIVFTVTGQAGDSLTFIPWTPKVDDFDIREFYYHNSLGGVDSFVCTGNTANRADYEQVVAERSLDLFHLPSDAMFIPESQRVNRGFQINSGYKPRAEIQATLDMFHINRMYEKQAKGGKNLLVPVIVQGSRQLPSRHTNLQAIEFTARYAFSERSIDRVS